MRTFNLTLMILIVSAASLAGCSSQHATYAPDGRRGYVISCGGFLNSNATCLVKAGRACGHNGYEVLKGSEDDRDMLIACKTGAHP